jgi:4-carboxymuconolactone decarboxylase
MSVVAMSLALCGRARPWHLPALPSVARTPSQLRQLSQVLADRVDADNARRAREALERQLAAKSGG